LSPSNQKMRTLLLADGSITIQRVIELTFAHEDVRVTSVGDGRKAMQVLESENPDVVLVDVDLPEMDGYSLAAHIRRVPRLKNVPILLLAGAFEPVDQNRAREVKSDGVIIKPFDSGLLQAEARELADRTLDAGPGFVLARLKDVARRDRSTALVTRAKSDDLKAPGKSRAHKRYKTTTPPITPAPMHCPSCARSLQYESSQIGGVNAIDPEQWDYYVCAQGCGRFQYRPRTRKLRIV